MSRPLTFGAWSCGKLSFLQKFKLQCCFLVSSKIKSEIILNSPSLYTYTVLIFDKLVKDVKIPLSLKMD